jgi:hypothetical protein
LLNIISGSLSTGAPPPSLTSYESIATVTVGSGGAANVEFTSIPSTFEHLQLRMIGRTTSSPFAKVQYNSDTTASNYRSHFIYGNGSSVVATNTADIAYIAYLSTSGNQANEFGDAVTDILDYKNTNKYKTARSINGNEQGSGGFVILFSHLWESTSAITAIKILPASGDFEQNTKIALYGIKGS